eukprot:351491-Chlamydomonas_euryale.AAC.24
MCCRSECRGERVHGRRYHEVRATPQDSAPRTNPNPVGREAITECSTATTRPVMSATAGTPFQ